MYEFLKQKWYIILYVVFLICTGGLVYSALLSGEDYRFTRAEQIPFAEEWSYTFSDGESGTTTLPAQLGSGDASELTLSNTLPELSSDSIFVYRSRHTVVKIYLDGELIYDQRKVSGVDLSRTLFSVPGNVWNELELTREDSGKEITIVSEGAIKSYLYGPGDVYLGERGSFYLELLSSRLGTFFGAFLLLVLALILIVIWAIFAFWTKLHYHELLCLALFLLSVALWEFTETRCLQFLFHNMRANSVFAFEILMLTPVPIALYFTFGKRRRTRFLAKIGAVIPLAVWAFNNTLHLTGIRDLGETLWITQLMLVFEILYLGSIQIWDIYRDSRHKGVGEESSGIFWKLPACGIAILIPLLLGEVVQYLFGNGTRDSSVMATVGVASYIISLAARSALKLASDSMIANEANRTKSQFLANMSHEIRTPLNAIMGFDELILRKTDNADIAGYASKIQNAGNSLCDIINMILDISKIEAGKLEIREETYETRQMIDQVLNVVTNQAAQKNLQMVLYIDPNLPEKMYGDEVHIRQVLINLLNNAVKYTVEGSIIFTMRLEKESAETDECEIFFSVKDTGVGIREEDRERLFEKFERLDYATDHEVEGIGLGMSIVVQLLSAMHSKIELDSVYGEGSEFYFSLRQKIVGQEKLGTYGEKQQTDQFEPQEGVRYIAPDASILIVDDVELNLNVACGLLATLKVQIDTASSGKQAIELAAQKKYDVILMDHMMPGMDGIEAAAKIRALAAETGDSYYSEVPILALTANAMSGMREKFIEQGFQDFISKPVEGKALEDAVLKWIPKDKIVEEQGTGQTEETEETADPSDGWNLSIDGIDLAAAKKYAPDGAMYHASLATFLQSVPVTEQRLRDYREAQDLEQYTITVHGLKSSARLIGATELSEEARLLEEHGHKGEAKDAWNGTDHLLDNLHALGESIRKATASDQKERVLTEEEYYEAIAALQECAENFDMEGLIEWDNTYRSSRVAPKFAVAWEELMSSVREVAFVEIQERIEKMTHIS